MNGALPSGLSPTAHRSPRRDRLWLWLPVVALMILIYYGASTPEPPVPSTVTDWSLHWTGYFALTLLLIRALAGGRWMGVTIVSCAIAVAVALLHGASVEWMQAYLPHRHAELRDLIADAIGALAAACLVGAWGIIRRL